jgi:hypothetical protein
MAEPDPAVNKVVRRRRRAKQGLDGLPNKDEVPEKAMVDPEPVVRRQRRAKEGLERLPNKDAVLEVQTEEPEPAVNKVLA